MFLGFVHESQLNVAGACQLLTHNQTFHIGIYKASSVAWIYALSTITYIYQRCNQVTIADLDVIQIK